MERLGIEWLEVSPHRIVARLPVERNTQPYGILHGGATAALCETVAPSGRRCAPARNASSWDRAEREPPAGIRDGHITAIGVPTHQGRTTAVWSMEVRDDGGALVAERLTLAVRDRVPSRPEPNPGAGDVRSPKRTTLGRFLCHSDR